MKLRIVLLLSLALLCGSLSEQTYAKSKKKKNVSDTTTVVKKKTAYEKLFEKPHASTKGMIDIHRVKDKLYFELPVALMEKDMLLGSTVTEISDAGDAIVGSKPKDPIVVFFTMADSTVQLRQNLRVAITDPQDKAIQRAIDKSNIGAILNVMKIEAWNPDSTAVVVDVTKIFVGDNKNLEPLDDFSANTYSGLLTRTARFQSDRSFLGEFKSFSDNVMVRSHLTYECDIRAGGNYLEYKKPVTVLATRTLIMLPEKPMQPRTADPRVGIFPSYRMKYASAENRAKPVYYANRWNLEPKDVEAYKRGELTEPVKPVIFYLDNNFPKVWAESIREGVERWNKPFEAIGFKNAVQVVPFPENDPEFDPDNIKYSCIRYSPTWIANAMGPSWTDPRSGEILNASVYIYHNIAKLIYSWRFVHTAAADPDVRTEKLPEELFREALGYVVCHEVGHCLGFMHNMAGSSSIPVDSLRSPSFTQKYGTTYSIMDYARNNYVAQPGDKERGVRLTPPEMGEYDRFLVKWLYSPLPEAETAEEKSEILTRWISERADDPVYRYGKQQVYTRYDPSSQSEDLGDDAVKAGEYGIKNLKIILSQMNGWFDQRGEDKDYNTRMMLYNQVLQQYAMYLNHAMINIGGIYLNEKYEGDPRPSFQVAPKEKQRGALKFLMAQLRDTEWLDDKELMKNMPICGSPATDFQKELVSLIVYAPSRLSLAEVKDPANAYTAQECMNDIYDFVWEPTLRGRTLTPAEIRIQNEFVSSLIKRASGGGGTNSITLGIADGDAIRVPDYVREKSTSDFGPGYHDLCGLNCCHGHGIEPGEVSGFNFLSAINYASSPSLEYLYYGLLKKSRALIERSASSGSEATRMHYRLLLLQIDKSQKK